MIPFEKIDPMDRQVGGKAWGLGVLAQRNFPVPPGIVLDREPDAGEWAEILEWWKTNGSAPLAVRSSASAEDSSETSFAGQNRTFLDVEGETQLRSAIDACFASLHRDNSKAYRKFFGQEQAGRMNVVLQVMVHPKFAGVFFSHDPIDTKSGWILEVVEGLGEDLVSGKVTPGRLRENGESKTLPNGFTPKMAAEVVRVGLEVTASLGFPLDMEWAIDGTDRFFVLQSRPITTRGEASDRVQLETELERLRRTSHPNTSWDGQTFAEWSGLPSPLTYSIWRRAFSPRHAFGNALREIGYRGFDSHGWKDDDSLLERVFGRAYVNLHRLADLYYGDIPYRIEPLPRPHTVFDVKKLGFHSFVHFPRAAWTMTRVGWNLATKRRAYYTRCMEELSLFKHRFTRPLASAADLARFDGDLLREQILEEIEEFTTQTLLWPLVLVVLTEATTQNLRQLLVGLLGPDEGERRLREWMGKGLHTVTFEMNQAFTKANRVSESRPDFMARYGHRGPGEMDLSNPRWFEIADRAFQTSTTPERAAIDHSSEIESEIQALTTFKREMVLEEWKLLKKLLEAREAWKMELLKPYAWLRLLVNEYGRRTGLGHDVHRLFVEEIASAPDLTDLRSRNDQDRAFRKISLPDFVGLRTLENALSGSADEGVEQKDGEPLSPGVAFGEVRFVTDPLLVDTSTWPTNVILVAESTDPGWTPLFARVKAIVVERGGVLSHCAILAREMGLPAVGGIRGIRNKFKDGDMIWVDGHHGRIKHDES